MAELYDGKMWLPSDMIPADELTASQFPKSMFSYYSSGPHSSTECFADSNLLHSNLFHRPYNTHFYQPAVQHGSLLQGCGAYGGNRMSASEAVHKFNQFLTPVQLQLQVEMLRREERMLRILPGQNLGIPRGVLKYEEQNKLSRGEYRGKGTGVFIPRTSSVVGIAARTTRTREDTLSSSFGNFSVRVDEKEMNAHFRLLAGARTKQEIQVHSHINSVKRSDTRKEADCQYQLPPELALPQEWTY